MFHIVNTDNFGGDYPNETFLSMEPAVRLSVHDLEWTTDPKKAQVWADNPQAVANNINRLWGEHSPRYCKVVSVGYVLQPGFEP